MKEPLQSIERREGEEFRLEEFLPYRLSVAADGVGRMIARQHLDQAGLGMPEWRLLAVIGRHGVLSPTVAGEYTAMDKVKVSRAAAGLVSRGLLKQTPDPADGRGRLLRLTRKGNAVFASIAPMARNIESAIAPCLTRSEWSVLQRALEKLITHTQFLLDGKSEPGDRR